ncbi:MAG: hypothetical protein IPP08_03275 [Chlorobiota bacterium]|nr:MAG: hypothetical protein IPP08_03275 [Chlorobiota bacterium]
MVPLYWKSFTFTSSDVVLASDPIQLYLSADYEIIKRTLLMKNNGTL